LLFSACSGPGTYEQACKSSACKISRPEVWLHVGAVAQSYRATFAALLLKVWHW